MLQYKRILLIIFIKEIYMNKKINYMRYLLFITVISSTFIDKTFSHVIEVSSSQEFNNYISQPNSAVFVEFYAPWCSPCTKAKPIVDRVATDKRFSAITFLCVNTDRTPEIAKQYNVSGVPTFSYFYSGRVMYQETGLKSVQTLDQTIASNFARFYPTLLTQIDSNDAENIVQESTTTTYEDTDTSEPEMSTTIYEKTTTTDTSPAEENNIIVKISAFFNSIFMAIKDAIMSFVDYIRSWFM